MRADARRNVESIRQAALTVFRENGLTSPLDDVARLAGKAKGTIYHRFGGRAGLIDAVVEELVAERVDGIITSVSALEMGAVDRLEEYLRRVWLLQFEEPAANDVFLRVEPDSPVLVALCDRARAFAIGLLDQAQAAGGIRPEVTAQDLYALIWERGVIAREATCTRQDYLRRCDWVLAGLRTCR